MTKQEFVQTIVEMHQDLPKARIERIMGDTFDVMATNLQKGEKMTWAGFGSFETTKRAARQGRNPQTGAPLQIAASTGVKFKAAKKLKDSLNG